MSKNFMIDFDPFDFTKLLELKMEAENGEWGENERIELMARYQRYRGIVEEQAYVIRGSVLTCQYGTKAVRIDCTEDHGVYVGSASLMTCEDCQHSNIYEFGSCMCPEANYVGRLPVTSSFFPDLSRAEKAPGNNLAHICRPLINLEQGWRQIDEELLIESHAGVTSPALLSNAVLVCNYGGIIRIREVPERVEVLEEEQEETTSRYVVWNNGVNVRAGHSMSAKRLKLYNATKRVEVFTGSNIFEDGEEWVKIKYDESEGGEAWIAYRYLLPDKDIVTTADMFPKEIHVEMDTEEWREFTDAENRIKNDYHGTYYPMDHWGEAGKYSDENKYKLFEQIEGKSYYNIAVGPKILNPKYPDDGDLTVFEAFSKLIDIKIKDKDTNVVRTLHCHRKDLKAHTYNHYPDEHKYGDGSGIEVTVRNEKGEKIENGFLQTGIRYPNAAVKEGKESANSNEEWVAYTVGGNIIEFCAPNTGDLNCKNYELVSITVHLEEEGENVETDV